jgi:hypothetical protein
MDSVAERLITVDRKKQPEPKETVRDLLPAMQTPDETTKQPTKPPKKGGQVSAYPQPLSGEGARSSAVLVCSSPDKGRPGGVSVL